MVSDRDVLTLLLCVGLGLAVWSGWWWFGVMPWVLYVSGGGCVPSWGVVLNLLAGKEKKLTTEFDLPPDLTVHFFASNRCVARAVADEQSEAEPRS